MVSLFKTVKKVGTTINLFTIMKAAIFIYIILFFGKKDEIAAEK
jgi:hypothetical protein